MENQHDGTILSIDFKDAFRSVHLRWFKLVLERMKIPGKCIEWFMMMYKDLYINIVINKYKSERVYIKRGFMEGHPPTSMAAFVVSMIPMMNMLEENLTGITTPDSQTHKIKLFADDMKLFLSKLNEIDKEI